MANRGAGGRGKSSLSFPGKGLWFGNWAPECKQLFLYNKSNLKTWAIFNYIANICNLKMREEFEKGKANQRWNSILSPNFFFPPPFNQSASNKRGLTELSELVYKARLCQSEYKELGQLFNLGVETRKPLYQKGAN